MSRRRPSRRTTLSFDELGLAPELLRAVREQGYTTPTPVQAAAIPPALAGRDLMAAAQTGTGKTAGFVLPVLERLMAEPGPRRRPVRALVLTPTRELAAQVADSAKAYGAHLPLRTAVVFGGVGMQPQVQALRRGVDLLVATPGRLLDHLGRGTLDLSRIEILVLDEADRMLDMGFIHDIRRVMSALPEKRQTLLFSATFPREVRELSSRLLDRPERVEVAPPNATADRVEQVVYHVARERKPALLADLILRGRWQQVLVFTRTKHGANRLARKLVARSIEAEPIHGNKSQNARTRALAGFKSGRVQVLVATEIAARGLDIEGLPHVVNFELPNVPEDYVHRIGRTARAGASGHAVSLVSAEEGPLLRSIERLVGQRLEVEVVEGYEPDGDLAPAPPARRGGATAPAKPAARARPPRSGRRRRSRERRRDRG